MATKALGATVEFSLDGGSTYQELDNVKEVSGLSLGTYSTVDITTLDNPDDFKRYVTGLADGAEISITGLWSGSTQQQALAGAVGQAAKFRLSLGTMQFEADVLILNFEITDVTVEGVLGFSCSMKINAKPTFTVS